MPTCRFCLEDTDTATNPLIDPCACRGSGQYIHTQCLRRWAQLDPAENGENCSICRTPFNVSFLPRLEVIPCKSIATVNLLHNITGASLLLQYFCIMYELRSVQTVTMIQRVQNAQLIIHALYTFCFASSVSITNKPLYYRECIASGMNLRLLLVHSAILWRFIAEEDMLMGFACTLMLNLYWPLHIQTLKRVNQILLEN